MGARQLAAVFLFCSLAVPAFADLELRQGTQAHFASRNEGAAILGQRDDFIERLSAFDRAVLMKTAKSVSTEEFLRFVRANVSGWTDAERAKVEVAITSLRPALDRLPLSLPKTISLIKTTGSEEGKAFYTRADAIVFPEGALHSTSAAELKRIVAHELFHILSRENPAVREALYRTIGFSKCPEVELPKELMDRRITNPDAPRNNHSIRLRIDGAEVAAVPVLFSKAKKYDVARGGGLFDYLQCALLVRTKGGVPIRLVPFSAATGFFEQVGRNTKYVIHPEEILADNFALLVTGDSKVTSPEILRRVEKILRQH